MMLTTRNETNASKALANWLMEKDQYDAFLQGSVGYLSHPLKAYQDHPVWTEDPKRTVFRIPRHGPARSPIRVPGLRGVRKVADFIVNMVAEATKSKIAERGGRRRAEARATVLSRVVTPAASGSGAPPPFHTERHRMAAITQTEGQFQIGFWDRINNNRDLLGIFFMLPAGIVLVLFLAWPLILGVWLGFTSAKVGRPGTFIGFENYVWLFRDYVFWLSVFNTFLYTVVASIIKFALGLWLAILLNRHPPFKAFLRAIVLMPFIVPTVLSALAFWWIYDLRIRSSLDADRDGCAGRNHRFPGPAQQRAGVRDWANIWRGIPFVAPRCWPGSDDPADTTGRSTGPASGRVPAHHRC